jgi:hypothetical protein
MPRRRRRAKGAKVAAMRDRGLLVRLLLHSPKDTVAGALAFAATTAIIANALLLQAGRHPSPMFGSVPAMPAMASGPVTPLPRPHPVESAPVPAEERSAEPRNFDPRPGEPKATDPVVAPPRATGAPAAATSNVLRPPAPIPALSRGDAAGATRRVIAVQRALAQLGYGQLKPTGTVGSDTQAAIQKFERARKLPVTGQISDRLVHELVVMVGHPIE